MYGAGSEDLFSSYSALRDGVYQGVAFSWLGAGAFGIAGTAGVSMSEKTSKPSMAKRTTVTPGVGFRSSARSSLQIFSVHMMCRLYLSFCTKVYSHRRWPSSCQKLMFFPVAVGFTANRSLVFSLVVTNSSSIIPGSPFLSYKCKKARLFAMCTNNQAYKYPIYLQ